MAFGFVNAPSTFQRAMNYIFRNLEFVIVYIDDILILSKTEEEHMEHIRAVFALLDEYNMVIRLDKCHFFQQELKYLGFIINGEGMRPDPTFVKKVINLQQPTDKKSVLRMIGMINWLSRYIPRFSDHIRPLTKLSTQKKIIWTNEHQAALDKLKQLIANAPLLRHPDLSKQFFVICDASDYGIGSVLMQKYNSILHPVEFWSSMFDKNQVRWHVSEKELAAVVLTLEKFAKYLLNQKFFVFTDHKNIRELHTRYDQHTLENSKLTRWLLRMEQFDFKCFYIKGILNYVADYLSRDVCMESVQREYDENYAHRKLSAAPLMKQVFFCHIDAAPAD